MQRLAPFSPLSKRIGEKGRSDSDATDRAERKERDELMEEEEPLSSNLYCTESVRCSVEFKSTVCSASCYLGLNLL